MTLAPGTRLGTYEITVKLGEGGMGEVYRARDSKLEREVAVKVLPAAMARDAEALARFEREAKAVAALSHPNILAIFDFGREGETAYAAMELLDGRTLADELATEGALPLRRVIELGAQAARGLAAAHERGVIHRDLKPANLFLTRDGRVKILDFGLAKVQEAGDSRSRLLAAPTLAPDDTPGTAAGTVLGTVGYMAPEQVRGEPADARSDLFALGAVLYELATGERAFGRETAAESMTAILREEPRALAAGANELPPALERVVRHCLEKSPQQRFRSADDLAFALESLVAAPSSSASAHAPAPEARRRRPAAMAALGAAALLAAGAVGWSIRAKAAATGAAGNPGVFRQITDMSGVESSPTLSPDGRDVVFVGDANGNRDLYVVRVGDRKPRLLTPDSPFDDWMPAYSPDGERIAFRSDRDGGGIFVMSASGDSVRRVTDFGFHPSWSPDGRELALSTVYAITPTDSSGSAGDLVVVDVATGQRRLLSRGTNAFRPSWSPHGQRVAFYRIRGGSGQRDLFTVAADGSQAEAEPTDVTNDSAVDWSPAWSPDGRWLYYSSFRGGTMNLWRLAIDEASGKVQGDPEPMTAPAAWSGEISFARDGRHFAFATLDWRSQLKRVGFDERAGTIVGAPEPMLQSNYPIRDQRISPDGEWVVMTLRGVNEDLAVARIDGSRFLRLTDDAFRDRAPLWSPDGSRIAFFSDRSGSYELWWIRPDGSGLEKLSEGDASVSIGAWSPDGRQIVGTSAGQAAILFDLGEGARPLPQRELPVRFDDGSILWPVTWSPDGGRLAGVVFRPDGGAGAIGLLHLANGRIEKLYDPGVNLKFLWLDWLSDGRRLVVRGERGISLFDTATREMRPLLAVGGYWIGESVDVTADGRWITWPETATEGDVWLAELGGAPPASAER